MWLIDRSLGRRLCHEGIMNNNLQNTAALEAKCKGVFSSTGYLNVGKECGFS